MTPRMSVTDPAGPQAGEIAWVWDVFLWVSIIVWVLVIAFFVISMWMSHRNPEHHPMHEQPERDRRLTHGIVVAGAATTLTLIGLLFISILSGNALASLEDDAEAINIRITGHQWWWSVDYEPNDPTKMVSTANEIHVPVGKLVHLELTSGDVIHSFWVPSVHGKKDLIPGRMNRTWIRVDEPGVFRGQCAEFCGLEHAYMELRIIAEPLDKYEQWLAHQRDPAPPPSTPQQERGLAIFQGSPCAMCHAVTGTSAGGRLGPDLTHVASRLTLGAGALPNNASAMAQWVQNAQRFKPGSHMPAIQYSQQDLNALLAFLEALQ
jgi:cytochrome c oxidase subunit II